MWVYWKTLGSWAHSLGSRSKPVQDRGQVVWAQQWCSAMTGQHRSQEFKNSRKARNLDLPKLQTAGSVGLKLAWPRKTKEETPQPRKAWVQAGLGGLSTQGSLTLRESKGWCTQRGLKNWIHWCGRKWQEKLQQWAMPVKTNLGQDGQRWTPKMTLLGKEMKNGFKN